MVERTDALDRTMGMSYARTVRFFSFEKEAVWRRLRGMPPQRLRV